MTINIPKHIDPSELRAAAAHIQMLRDELTKAQHTAAEFERLRRAAERVKQLPGEIAKAESDFAALNEASMEYSLFLLGQPEVSMAPNPNTPDNVLTHRIVVTFRSPVNGEPKVVGLEGIAQGSMEERALIRADALPLAIARLAETPEAAMVRYRRGRSLGYLPS
ncbi:MULTISPECIES: hypothetical protein [unclassified Cupriavidus]|uniref:hypothetical protein n=1 Tax=unclassified Cupriavidus TaxID=2640874 RepID=UPI001BFFE1B5|nr:MULTISPECIES: hypothetical protein [unclassified Cupriavidus]MCA3184303.1 hypothetical protein [Cupriavidus sp.]MCA3190969.1 hypothetical protein [Cupriavidus sp.]MCA3199313.1 hypothetical protein [Cupriavidus sp.]MCA3204580.1 hypothetical protein [Cupriavidus sp.]MCA3209051.1 hypothetical protein [Cupriavidus sp.]